MTNPTPHGQVPEALRLADEWRSKTQREADRRNSAYDYYGMNNAPETVDPLGYKMAAELLRQHTRLAELEAQVEALSGVQALSAGPATPPAPQPAPVAQGDAEDAARYRWLKSQASETLLNPRAALSEICADMRTHWKLPTLICSGPVGGYLDFDASIDAARSHAKEGQSHD